MKDQILSIMTSNRAKVQNNPNINDREILNGMIDAEIKLENNLG